MSDKKLKIEPIDFIPEPYDIQSVSIPSTGISFNHSGSVVPHPGDRMTGFKPPVYKFEDAIFSKTGHKIVPGSEKVTVDPGSGEATIEFNLVQPIYSTEYTIEFDNPNRSPFDQERYNKSVSELQVELSKIFLRYF
jgi:hypothetical protein